MNARAMLEVRSVVLLRSPAMANAIRSRWTIGSRRLAKDQLDHEWMMMLMHMPETLMRYNIDKTSHMYSFAVSQAQFHSLFSSPTGPKPDLQARRRFLRGWHRPFM